MAAPPEKKGRMDDAPADKGRMAVPPKGIESTTITMVLQRWAKDEMEQFSPVYRVNGFPFRLRMQRRGFPARIDTYVVCEKSSEAELWKCTATITECWTEDRQSYKGTYVFCSWKEQEWEILTTGSISSEVGSSLQVTIVVKEGKNSWCSKVRPTLDSASPADGILVIGEEKKEIRVNKEFLASQSPYFDRLFFGDFKEKNMDKIAIGDVKYKEFHNIIEMVYGSEDALLNDDNLLKVLDLADRFELKIVEDKVVSYLLVFENNYFSLAKMLLISQERNIPILKKLVLEHEGSNLMLMGEMKFDPEYAEFSDATKLEILDRMMDLAQKCRC